MVIDSEFNIKESVLVASCNEGEWSFYQDVIQSITIYEDKIQYNLSLESVIGEQLLPLSERKRMENMVNSLNALSRA
jgi:hypothetical protein